MQLSEGLRPVKPPKPAHQLFVLDGFEYFRIPWLLGTARRECVCDSGVVDCDFFAVFASSY